MKNFYNISKGQLTTGWIFGIFLFLFTEENELDIIIVIVVLFFLVFYTIGWRNNNKLKK